MQLGLDFTAEPEPTRQFFCIVRHGDYKDGRLDDRGRKKMEHLGRTLKLRFKGLKVVLLSSPINRAKESAEILGVNLEIPFTEHQCLAAPGDSLEPKQIGESMRLFDEKCKEFDVVIFTTHMPFIDKFPTHWASTREFEIPRGFDRDKGSAVLIDVFARKWEHICGQ